MDHNQRNQPPPDEVEQRAGACSRVRGWPRIVNRDGRCEVYWKGHSDVMILIAHSLSLDNAESLCRDIDNVTRKYRDIPFSEGSNV